MGPASRWQAVLVLTAAGRTDRVGAHVLGVLLGSDCIFHDYFRRFLCDYLLGTSGNPR